MPLNPACTMPSSVVDDFKASSWPAAALQAAPQSI